MLRDHEFSPLKNCDSAKQDNPSSARQAIYNLHKQFILNAGGSFINDNESNGLSNCEKSISLPCEISPLVSYEGEGLEGYVKGVQITLPFTLESSEKLEKRQNGSD